MRGMVMPFVLPTEKTQKRIESDYYVEGMATTFDKPYELFEIDGVKYYETIDRHALDEADMSDVILQYDHHGKVFARQSNGTLGLEILPEGLLTYADLSKSRAAKDMHEEIDNGLITKMSWAFTVREHSFDRQTKTIIIRKVKKVYDVSAVSIPANNNTSISARSWIDGVIEQERQELARRKRLALAIHLNLEELKNGKIS